MDDFLKELYQEELQKTSSAELEGFMQTLDTNDLESVLGIRKLAVDGPSTAALPSPSAGSVLDADQKAVRDHVSNEHAETPTKRTEMPSSTLPADSKAKPVTKEAMSFADRVGRLLAKTAAEDLDWYDRQVQARQAQLESKPLQMIGGGLSGGLAGAILGHGLSRGGGAATALGGALGAGAGAGLGALTSHMAKRKRQAMEAIAAGKDPKSLLGRSMVAVQARNESPGLNTALGGIGGGLMGAGLGMRGGGKGALLGGALGAGAGAGLGYLGSKLSKKERVAIQRMKEKSSMGGMEDMGGGAGGLISGGTGGQGMETTASMQAKIAMRALRAIKGAPDHIKEASIPLTARLLKEARANRMKVALR